MKNSFLGVLRASAASYLLDRYNQTSHRKFVRAAKAFNYSNTEHAESAECSETFPFSLLYFTFAPAASALPLPSLTPEEQSFARDDWRLRKDLVATFF